MLFPDSIKEQFARYFYDKSVDILNTETTKDSEGGIIRSGATVTSTFKGNVQFTISKEVQNEIGLTKEFDIAITAPTDTAVEIDTVMQYNGIKYIATEVFPYDSHKLIVGSKWQ